MTCSRAFTLAFGEPIELGITVGAAREPDLPKSRRKMREG